MNQSTIGFLTLEREGAWLDRARHGAPQQVVGFSDSIIFPCWRPMSIVRLAAEICSPAGNSSANVGLRCANPAYPRFQAPRAPSRYKIKDKLGVSKVLTGLMLFGLSAPLLFANSELFQDRVLDVAARQLRGVWAGGSFALPTD